MAAAVFTPVEEMVPQKRTEKGVKDFFREGRVDNLGMAMQTVVLEGVGVVVGVEVVVEDTQGEAVGIMRMILVEEGEVPITQEKISKLIAVSIQLVMARSSLLYYRKSKPSNTVFVIPNSRK